MTKKIDWSKVGDLPKEEIGRLLDADHDDIDENPPATDAELATARPGTRRPVGHGRPDKARSVG